MNTSAWVIPAVIALLVAGVFFAGCSDESAATNETAAQSSVTTAATAAGALFGEGDIVKNPKSTLNTGILIISYDAGTDMYERALIYPRSDGSWGYRADSATTKMSRTNLEKVYTEKISSVTVSSVSIGAPTTATTVATTATAKTTTAVATTTTSGDPAPVIQDIDPFIGTAGTTVSITDLEGLNFKSGANVSLTKSGEDTIDATSVSVSSSTKITCKFVLPLGTEAGQWNVKVVNTDGKSHTSPDLFTVYKNTSATATATTTTTSSTSSSSIVTIYSLSPNVVTLGGGSTYKTLEVTGTNFSSSVTNFKLVSGSNILTGTGYLATSTQQARASFDIPAGYSGTYTISAVDSSGNVLGSLTNGFVINP